jgi:hypothetical protein
MTHLHAVPPAGDTSTYARLATLEHEAFALYHSIVTYRAIPAHPSNAEYRERSMARIEENIADMKEALENG